MADFDCDIVADDNGFPVHIKFTGSRIELLGEDGKKNRMKIDLFCRTLNYILHRESGNRKQQLIKVIMTM